MKSATRSHIRTNRNPAARSAQKSWGRLLGAGLLAGSVSVAYGAAEFKLSDEASLSVGIGLRASYTNLQNGAPNGTSGTNNFAVENARLFTNASYGKIIKATMNFNASPGNGTGTPDNLRLMDGIAQFEFNEGFKIWMGRFLPPSDRSNLYGPFYTSAWSFPGIASAGYGGTLSIIAGRDDGAMVWGNLFDSKLTYSVGAFNGHNRVAGLSNQEDNLLYSGRLEYNFWDAEGGYYRNATYLGAKNVFAIGASVQSQKNGVGSAAAPGKLKIWDVDLLIEKKFGAGYVPTFEGLYERYDLGAVDCGSGETGSPGCLGGSGSVGGLVAGKSYLATVALLFPQVIGWGQFQPFIRYQKLNRDVTATTSKGTDFGVNYLIKGFNAKVSAVYTRLDDSRLPILVPAKTSGANQFVLGVQLNY
jgi:hypothetical protein